MQRSAKRGAYRAWRLLPLLCWVAPSAGLSGEAVRSAGDGARVRVMTFNVRYGTANDGQNQWKNRRELVFKVLGDHRPEVVGLQEALRFQIDEIRAALPEYAEVGVARDDGRSKGEYAAILYRRDRFRVAASDTFWFSDTPEVPGSASWGNTVPRICTWARLEDERRAIAFYVYNVHLDHASQPSREKSARLLSRRVASRDTLHPVVVIGDFNAGENNPAMRYLRGEAGLRGEDDREALSTVPLVDSFRVLHPDAELAGTFNGFRGERGGGKIDHVLVPQWVSVVEAAIVRDNAEGRYPSDHFPVMATLNIPRVRDS